MTDTVERSWRDNRIARVLIMFFSLMLIYIAAQACGQIAAKNFPAMSQDVIATLAATFAIVACLAAYVWLVHRLEHRRPIAELRPAAAPLGIFLGLIVGIALISAVIAVIDVMGDASVALGHPPTLPFFIIAMAAISGVCEELIFRGALFRVSEEMFGTLVALIISGAFFGGAHIFNPHASWVSSAAITIGAGFLLGFAYTATRSLWLPIGLHAGWNLAEGGIYSTSVSGGKVVPGVFLTHMNGPDIMTGGGFGPEASVAAMGVGIVLTIVFAVITFRRGEWKGLRFQIRAA